MDNMEKNTEQLNEEKLDKASGGHGGHIDYIICRYCGYEIKLEGWNSNFCPRCRRVIR